MTRTEMLEQIAGGSCVGIECADCPVRPHPGGGHADCVGRYFSVGTTNLPPGVRAHARNLLTSDKRIKELEARVKELEFTVSAQKEREGALVTALCGVERLRGAERGTLGVIADGLGNEFEMRAWAKAALAGKEKS